MAVKRIRRRGHRPLQPTLRGKRYREIVRAGRKGRFALMRFYDRYVTYNNFWEKPDNGANTENVAGH